MMQTVRRMVLTFDSLIAVSLLLQFISLGMLWGHPSDTGTLFGRFSVRYGMVLALNAAFAAGAVAAYAERRRFEGWLRTLAPRLRYGALALIIIGLIGLGFASFEPHVRQYFALDLMIAGLALVWHQPPQLPGWILPATALIALPLLLLTTLIRFPFSPDEAHWADYASSAITHGGVYAHTWLQQPFRIYPGVGWSVAGYGWALEHVAFDIRTGRIWNFVSYLLAFAGIAALAWRLYGRRAAILSAAFAALSMAFIPVFDYRPDHQIAFASVWVVFAVAQAQWSHQRRWSLLAGLLAALSLELHAIGIALVIGLGLYYLAQLVMTWFRQRRFAPAPLAAFVAGAALGGTVYFVFNVLPVGGLTPFLTSLVSERLGRGSAFVFLSATSFFDGVIVLVSLAYLVWRRQTADRFLVSVLLCLWLSLLVVDTQGYRTPVIALYAVAVGALLAEGFERRQAVAAACLAAALIGQVGAFIDWGGIANGMKIGQFPNYVYEDIGRLVKPYLRDDDVILSSHLMIWGLHDRPNLYSYAGELTAQRRWKLSDPIEVWERVQPSVVIFIKNEMVLNPGATAYMQQHSFQQCRQFNMRGLDVTIYRPNCLG